jgi:hypothetical protein
MGIVPQVSYEGHVFPCCWFPYENQIVWNDGRFRSNPFRREDFNIRNNRLVDILSSDDWNRLTKDFILDAPQVCHKNCGTIINHPDYDVTSNSRTPKTYDNHNKEYFFDSVSNDPTLFLENMIEPQDIRGVGFELTSRCSLACPYCTRTKQKGKSLYYKGDLPLESISKSLVGYKWQRINDCNTYGDSIFYPYYHEFLNILKYNSIGRYELSTAATGKGKQWWDTTIEKFVDIQNSGTDIALIFGIDELEDMPKLNRVGQNFDEIFHAMVSAKKAGIKYVIWQFIPFSHNEHRIEEVKDLAKSVGVNLRFTLSNRFGKNDPMRPKNPDLSS